MISGGHPPLHGARSAGGRHHIQPRLLPPHRHVRVRPGAVGAVLAVPRARPCRPACRVHAAIRGGVQSAHPGANAGEGGGRVNFTWNPTCD